MLAINGYSGFIGQALLKELDKQGIKYRCLGRIIHGPELEGITKIIFLSSPSDSDDFKDREQTTISMIDNYVQNINTILNINPDIEVIFGSSVAVMDVGYRTIDSLESSYAIYKLAIEHYIRSRIKKYRIVRIPRVYGKDRKKGLMKFLREKPIEEFDDNRIRFIDINDFTPKFVELILLEPGNPRRRVLSNGIQTDKIMTPKQIKDFYEIIVRWQKAT